MGLLVDVYPLWYVADCCWYFKAMPKTWVGVASVENMDVNLLGQMQTILWIVWKRCEP